MAFWALDGCTGSEKTACEQYFPDFDSRLENAVLALKPWNVEPTAKRGLATIPVSVHSPNPVQDLIESPEATIMARSDRESWLKWSKMLLDDTQAMIDLVEHQGNLPEVSRELNMAANYLVATGGYALKGDARKMIVTIKKVREITRAAHDHACTNPI